MHCNPFFSLHLSLSLSLSLKFVFQVKSSMEPQQQNEEGIINGGSGSSNSGNKSSFLCRQSTTRWTPTAEQIRILKDLYYNNGVRSPSAEQIQKISAKLRQYGKIEGKNVFYWFQNHKARERQKKRLTTSSTEINNNHHHPIPTIHRSGAVWRSHEDPTSIYTSSKLPGGPSPSASTYGLHGFNQLGNYGYGSLAMEKSFRDCSISPGGNSGGGGGSMVHNFMWAAAAAAAVGVHDHHHHHPNYHHQPPSSSSSYSFQKKCYDNNIETLQDDEDQDQEVEEEEEDHDDQVPRELETLPLFPMHEENHNHNNNNIVSGNFCNMMMKQETENYYMNANNWYHYSDTTAAAAAATGMAGCCSRASLELTLNSYSSATGYSRSPNAP